MSDSAIPPLLRYQITVVADRGLPTRMGWATVRATARWRIVVAVVLVVAVLAVTAAVGATSVVGLVVAVAVGLVLAGWFAAGATVLIVSARWRRMLPPRTPMSVHYERDGIGYFLGRSRHIPLAQVHQVRHLGTAIHITTGRARVLFPIELVPPPIADFLIHRHDTPPARPAHVETVAGNDTGWTDCVAALDYWSQVQALLVEQGRMSGGAPLFGLPYVVGRRVVLGRGPGNAEDSDGFTDYSIGADGDGYCLWTTTRSRGDWYPDRRHAQFGQFDDAARYFVARMVAGPTRMRYRPTILPVTTLQWRDRGLAPGWSAESSDQVPAGAGSATRYTYSADPDRWYVTDSTDTATSFLLNLSWRELLDTYTDGIPDIGSLRAPRFSDD